MPSLRQLLLGAITLVSTAVGQAQPQTSQGLVSNDRDPETFRELLNALPEESLHAALDNHLRPKYQDGVFEYDKAALERVHEDDPLLASKLVVYAVKLELLKRQNTNTTISSSTSDPSTVTAETTGGGGPSTSTDTQDTTTPTPVTITTTTNSEGSTVIVTSETIPPQPPATVSIVVPVTTTDSAGNLITTSTAQPAIVISTTDSAGQATVITTPSPTLGQLITTTDAQGSTFITTYTPGGGIFSSLVVITTTLPNGDVAVITSYEIVNGNPTGSNAASSRGPTSTRGPPSLQSGAANVLSRRWGMEAAAMVGGAVGVAWFM